MLSFCAQVRSTPAHQFVDEGRSQSFESFRRTSSLKPRRCAPASPRWPRSARSPVHWCSGALAGLIFLGCSHAVGAAESGPCLAGEVRRRTSPPGGVGGHLRAARKVRGRRTASNSCPHRLILCAAHTPWSSIRGHRYDYARRGARRRPRPYRARPWCRRCRRCRLRRPRRRPSRAARATHGVGWRGCNGRQTAETSKRMRAARRGSGAAAAGPGPARGCSMVAYVPVEVHGAHVRTRCMCFGTADWPEKKCMLGEIVSPDVDIFESSALGSVLVGARQVYCVHFSAI